MDARGLTTCHPDSSVFVCKASYYNPSTRKWIQGRLFLRASYITFVEETEDKNKNPNDIFHLYISLSNVTSIQRKQSTFVFAAIIIMVGSTVHWFSSFPNRDSVFNLLEVFWRGLLYSGPRINQNARKKVRVSGETGHTKLGSELLNIAYESQKTLSKAALMLEHQGRQLEESENTVEDINNDLSVAESLISTLSFWHPKSKARSVKDTQVTQSVKRNLHEVVFSPSCKSPEYNIWLQGKIEVKNNELCIYDMKDQIKCCFSRTEIPLIQILSPWKLRIHQKSGMKTITYDVMCPALSRVLNVLTSVYKDKVIFEKEKLDVSFNSFPLLQASSTSNPNQTCGEIQVQEIGSISDEEIKELSSVLTNLQAMAIDVGREQEAQVEKINHLVSSVDKTDARMKADIVNIKEIT